MLLKPVIRSGGYFVVDLNHATVGGPFTSDANARAAITMAENLTRPSLENSMTNEGYHRLLLSEVNGNIRGDIAAAVKACPNCPATTGYQGYRRSGSYRAFVVCNSCGYYEEF